MPSRVLERLRDEALKLPEAERAELAHDLVKSLDGNTDIDAGQEWEAEILRRLDAIDRGEAETVDRTEFTRRIRERIKKF